MVGKKTPKKTKKVSNKIEYSSDEDDTNHTNYNLNYHDDNDNIPTVSVHGFDTFVNNL